MIYDVILNKSVEDTNTIRKVLKVRMKTQTIRINTSRVQTDQGLIAAHDKDMKFQHLEVNVFAISSFHPYLLQIQKRWITT